MITGIQCDCAAGQCHKSPCNRVMHRLVPQFAGLGGRPQGKTTSLKAFYSQTCTGSKAHTTGERDRTYFTKIASKACKVRSLSHSPTTLCHQVRFSKPLAKVIDVLQIACDMHHSLPSTRSDKMHVVAPCTARVALHQMHARRNLGHLLSACGLL